MALDWNELLISVVDPDTFLVTEDELIYSLRAEYRMIIFSGEKGEDGKDGDSVNPVGAWSSSESYKRLDIVTHNGSSYIAEQDVPINISINNYLYWMQLAERGPQGPQGERGPAGYGSLWGDIGGTLSNQTDLQNALNAKANSADLGDLAELNNIDYTSAYLTNKPTLGNLASQDTVDYDTEVTNKPTLGALASQDTVDYETEVTNKPTLGNLASKDTVDYATEVTNKPTLGTMSAVNDASSDNKAYGRKDGAWYDLDGRYYTESEIDSALANKANLTIIAPTFSTSTAYAVGDYVVYNGVLYRFTSAHSAGAWNSSHVSAVNVGDELEGKSNVGHTHDNRYYTEAEVDAALSGKVSKSGDTMTGDLSVKSLTADNNVAPSAITYQGVNFKDKNDNACGRVRGFWSTSGSIGASLVGYRVVNGANIVNELAVAVSATGERVIAFSDAGAWRTSLEVYSKTEINNKMRVQYFENRAVSVATGAQIMRIPASGTNSSITTDTIVLDCQFTDKSKVLTNSVEWTSYDGYIVFSGTCTEATSADVIIWYKSN